MTNAMEKLNDIQKLTKRLKKDFPTETNAFLGFLNKAEAGKALDIRQKELINVGLAVAAQCEWCIAFHVHGAVEAGASREEIIEAGFMAVIMHGGPAYMYMTPLLNCIDDLSPKTSGES